MRTAAAFLLVALALLLPHPARAQPLQNVTGVWRGVEASPAGPMGVEVIFFPNGTYSRAHKLGMLMTRDSGRFEVVQNWIHFTLQNWAPTEYQGQPLAWPTSDTWLVTNYDGRVLETANLRVERVQ